MLHQLSLKVSFLHLHLGTVASKTSCPTPELETATKLADVRATPGVLRVMRKKKRLMESDLKEALASKHWNIQ